MRAFTRFLERLKAEKQPDPIVLVIGGEPIEITLRRHATAQRMTLRLSEGGAVLTLPKRTSRVAAESFVATSRPWLAKQLAKREPKRSFVDGMSVPLRGEAYVIAAVGGSRGVVRLDAESKSIVVPGDAAHVSRRLTDFLKAEAKRDLDAASRDYAAKMGVKFSRLTVRDQKSRWGSCSADGALSYSWRLILAPTYVLDYVAAHEVAHLKEMNHGPRFWRLVLTHCKDARRAKQWLKLNGRKVHSYG